MTVEELHEKYGFDKEATIEEMMKYINDLHPIYKKHLPACWIIQDVYGHAMNEKISPGKARELTAAIIEEHLKEPEKQNEETKHLQILIDNKNAYIETIDNKNSELKQLSIELWQVWEALAEIGQISISEGYIENYNRLKTKIDSL